MLRTYGIHLSEKGPIFGGKYLVVPSKPDKIPPDGCIACLSYLSAEPRRKEWCSKGCAHHPRPDGMGEADFITINLYASNNTAAHQTIAGKVVADKAAWKHLDGVDDRDAVMGGKGGQAYDNGGAARSAATPASYRQPYPRGGKGKGRGGGGKGSGGKGSGGKGSSGGKGKGGRIAPFQRRR